MSIPDQRTPIEEMLDQAFWEGRAESEKEMKALRARVEELEGLLRSLSGEAHGFLSLITHFDETIRESVGVANVRVLRHHTDEARAALAGDEGGG